MPWTMVDFWLGYRIQLIALRTCPSHHAISVLKKRCRESIVQSRDVEHTTQKPSVAFESRRCRKIWLCRPPHSPCLSCTTSTPSTTNRSIVTLDRNALDPQTLELLTPPEQQLFRWLSGEFRFQEQDPWTCLDWANLKVLQGMVNAPLSEVGLSNSITPWLKIRGPLHDAGHDWAGLVGARLACLGRCWQGSLRSEWLVEHAPPCGLVSIASELAQTDETFNRSLRKSHAARAEGTDLSHLFDFIRLSVFFGPRTPRAIMMFRQATFAVPSMHHISTPCLRFLRSGKASLALTCAEVAAPDLSWSIQNCCIARTHAEHDRRWSGHGSMLGWPR